MGHLHLCTDNFPGSWFSICTEYVSTCSNVEMLSPRTTSLVIRMQEDARSIVIERADEGDCPGKCFLCTLSVWLCVTHWKKASCSNDLCSARVHRNTEIWTAATSLDLSHICCQWFTKRLDKPWFSQPLLLDFFLSLMVPWTSSPVNSVS